MIFKTKQTRLITTKDMNITEEVKQEADSVVEKYIDYSNDDYWDTKQQWELNETRKQNATFCAIQDRQSVLEELIKINNSLEEYLGFDFDSRAISLTQQIEYLKSKI